MHEIGQSPYNAEVDQGKTEWVSPEPGKTYLTTISQQTVTKTLKKSSWNCHEDNSNWQPKCINNFYHKKLGCILPWLDEEEYFKWPKCIGNEKFWEFRNLSLFIHQGKLNDQLEREGTVYSSILLS